MLIPSKHSGYQVGIRLYPGGGKGGSSAPPPDPALIAAQIRSMGIQDSMITKMMTNADAMLPLQQEQMQFGIDTARTAYGQSQQDRDWMLDRRGSLSGLQDTLVKDAAEFNTADKTNQLVGQAQADVNAGFSSARDQGQRALSRAGVNPNSGKSLAMNNQASIAQASALAGVSNKARQDAVTEGRALTDRATNALAGYPAMSAAATGAGAGYGGMGLSTANNGLAGMNSGFSAVSGAAGQMGSNASNMFSAQASYKNQQDQMANQGDPFMNLLGQAGGMWAMGGFKTSDINAKEGIEDLAQGEALEKVKAIPVSEWQYKPGRGEDPGRHIGPMAQDVNQIVGERAAPGGTKVDLVSLNGLNMAATQDLSSEVDALKSEVRRLSFKGGIHG